MRPARDRKRRAPQRIHHRYRCQAEQHRQAANEELAHSHLQPELQEQVIQRHVDIKPPQQMQQVGPVETGHLDADSLVKPETLAGEQVEPENCGSGNRQRQQQEIAIPRNPAFEVRRHGWRKHTAADRLVVGYCLPDLDGLGCGGPVDGKPLGRLSVEANGIPRL
jgi:hypothetical protein